MTAKQRIIIGAGTHAQVVLDALAAWEEIDRYILLDDDERKIGTYLYGIYIQGNIALIDHLAAERQYEFIMGIGEPLSLRAKLFQRALDLGLVPFTVVHPNATVSSKATIGLGTVVLAGSIIGPSARIGANCIINNGVLVEHGCVVQDHAHIAPHATLLGQSRVFAEVFVGAGSVTLPGVHVRQGAIVGAGAVVLNEVHAGQTVAGVPAKVITRSS